MTNTDKTVSTERLEELKDFAERTGAEEVWVPAEALTELLASRTQEPAEWQVEAALEARVPGGSQVWHWIDGGGMKITETHRSVMRTILEALRAASITPPAPERSKEEVGVKVLEWAELTSPREDGPPEPTGDVEAVTMIGEYSVWFDSDEDVSETPWRCWGPNENIGHFADPSEAKAAAQADYEQRIRSALEPASLHKGEAGKHSDDCGCGYCT